MMMKELNLTEKLFLNHKFVTRSKRPADAGQAAFVRDLKRKETDKVSSAVEKDKTHES